MRANSLLRAYTPENFARELDAVTHAFLEGMLTIDPIRKEVRGIISVCLFAFSLCLSAIDFA